MILQVLVAKLAVVFHSWMIERTARFGLAAVACVFGTWYRPSCTGTYANGLDVVYCLFLCNWSLSQTGVECIAAAMQQVLFGEKLSHYVQVRQFVGINSTLMKAMRYVVGKKDLSISKVAILIGGLDWPTLSCVAS